jgi:hypothetical protein
VAEKLQERVYHPPLNLLGFLDQLPFGLPTSMMAWNATTDRSLCAKGGRSPTDKLFCICLSVELTPVRMFAYQSDVAPSTTNRVNTESVLQDS